MKYLVASFEIDTVQFEIMNDKTPIAVEPKVFDLIVYLIEQRRRPVTREELFEKIWVGREVSDTTLSNSIKSARKILGDSGELQGIIKTIRGRGYQFVADVIELSSNAEADIYSPKVTTPSNNHSLSIQALTKELLVNSKLGASNRFFYTTLVLFFIAILVWQFLYNHSSYSDALERPYILVTPFDVSGEDEEKWQPFADQMTKEVIRNLRKISGLNVVPPSSAFTFKKDKTQAHIKEQLPNVRYVLSATINMSGHSVIQVTPELEDLNTGNLLWDNEYQSRIDDTTFFSIKAEMATSVSESLKVVILEEEKMALGELPTRNLTAYELYVSGQLQLDLLTHKSLQKAVKLFSKAIALDPEFEAAYIAKANAYRIIMVYFEKPSEVLPKVIEAVAEILKINPKSAEARSSLGLAYVFAWRWQDAWDMLSQARELNPNLAMTELGFALYYCGLGNIKGVHESLAIANQLDPLNAELADWGSWALSMVGEIDGAIKWSEEKMQLHPDVGLIFASASVAASLAGEHERAISLAQESVRLDAGSSLPILALAQAYGHAGEIEKILPLLEKAQNFNSYLCEYETAVAYLLMNDLDKTFEHLNKAVGHRSNCLIFTRNDPRLEPIRHESRYLAILTRVGLDDKSVRKYSR